MSRLARSKVAAIVLAVVEAMDRIPDELADLTFFSRYDLWYYFAIMDDVTCILCSAYNGQVLYGTHLRYLFKYLEIEDDNLILPKQHPNCRCELRRMTL